jgi:uncharacterized protein (DUF433 family)
MHNGLIEFNWRDEPAISGTSVTVAHILEQLMLGENIDTICSEHSLTRDQVHAALSYAELSLLHPQLDQVYCRIPKSELTLHDELDYSLLADNAGYFNSDACSLHLLRRYKRRAKHTAPAAV